MAYIYLQLLFPRTSKSSLGSGNFGVLESRRTEIVRFMDFIKS
jgi:hypothetical protein